MKCTMDLSGVWKLALDKEKQGFPVCFDDTICLPDTTSHAGKGSENSVRETGFLTDTHLFEGYAWYQRELTIPAELAGLPAFLVLERTRKTTLYLDGECIGSETSLTTPHRYDLTGVLSPGVHTLTILVDNTNYPTKGGHLTSPDTQTNWNGITGALRLDFFPEIYISDLKLETDIHACTVTVSGHLHGSDQAEAIVSVLPNVPSGAVRTYFDMLRSPLGSAKPKLTALYPVSSLFHGPNHNFAVSEDDILLFDSDQPEDWMPVKTAEIGSAFRITYPLSDEADDWSEYTPVLHALHIQVGEDIHTLFFGLREMKSAGDKFTVNGTPTFLRGKHDGLIFPLTGAAPTTAEEWLHVMEIIKSYGINHYRFHTCCPPEAAFVAADLLGIYMEPELPFWGTLAAPGEEEYHEEEQAFLIREGERILNSYGTHPSFVMFSLGNELWGSANRMSEILKQYKNLDSDKLYTQGSNNFQWTPVILPEDDFFCGVRFSIDRQLRGSYAMCDVPLGHVQTTEPSTVTDYDMAVNPLAEYKKKHSVQAEPFPLEDVKVSSEIQTSDSYIEIQYGTGVKRVKASELTTALIPEIPVVGHEVGQYETFVNFKEIEKYTGSIKARNFEIFRERLREKGMLSLAADFFKNSGRLAMDCYKEELESFFRSRRMAGFQLLDLQDFSGQGTALVGVLDAFLDSKGLISPEEWRTFCSDTVLLARFPKFNYLWKERFTAHIELACFRPENPGGECLLISLGEQQMTVPVPPMDGNYIDICDISLPLPKVESMTELNFELQIQNTEIRKGYSIWVYPDISVPSLSHPLICTDWKQAKKRLSNGEAVLYLPKPEELSNSLPGFYCTDFWCYPMFRSISEWMKKDVPVGTMGLNIHNKHKSLRGFPCRTYSTKPWWNLIEHSRAIILDELPKDYFPIVQTIDNFERNHKLGTLLECRCQEGRLFVCAIDFAAIAEKPEAAQLLTSLLKYVSSEEFQPKDILSFEVLDRLFV